MPMMALKARISMSLSVSVRDEKNSHALSDHKTLDKLGDNPFIPNIRSLE